jgi:hypothetical protein
MHVELKKVKFHEDMSDETNCFSAEVWTDGKYLAHVRNDGQGGCHMYDVNHSTDHARWEAFSAWCKAQPLEFNFEYEDQIVNKLFDEWLKADCDRREQAQIKRWCRTQTVFRLKGDEEGHWHTVKALYSGKVKQYLVAKYGDKVECIANEGVPA